MRFTPYLPALAILCIAFSAVPSVRDSILACTGNTPARFAWTRWPWCDANYTPVQAYKSTASENDHSFTQVVVYSTEDGNYRLLDSTIGNHCFPRFTRKNGNYVFWSDKDSLCTWIRDFAGTTPKRKLFTYAANGSYFSLGCHYNPVSDSEYIYILFDYNWQWAGTSILRVPFKADYTLDWTKKVTVVNGAGKQIDWHGSASQDGKYIGCMVPQPEGYLWQAGTTTKYLRHDANSDYGCQSNIAPDNSYRFLHLTDAHVELAMWGAGTAASTPWRVEIASKLPYNTARYDINSPRWTNDVRFMTVAYPLTQGLSSGGIFSMGATDVRNANPTTAGSVCLVRFNADFTAVESAARVSDGDIRHREVISDGWIGQPVSTRPSSTPRVPGSSTLRMVRASGRVTIASTTNANIEIQVADAQGRILRRSDGPMSIDLQSLGAGVFQAIARDRMGRIVQHLAITK